MTEAQYICTGGREQGLDLLHFGLGVERYTHFTSPIRRYADVVVHKQLLASLLYRNRSISSIRFITQFSATIQPLKAVPESNVVSILAGEGLHDTADEFIDELPEGASNNMSGTEAPCLIEECKIEQPDLEDSSNYDVNSFENGKHDTSTNLIPYNMTQVAAICDGLNLHNRLAKQSSFECQSLFLSLYFRDHVESTQAVVTQLRENGFWVYVPKFDMRGPVYIRDTNNDIQIDPILLGLPLDAGYQSTLGFSTSSCRRFPDGRTELSTDPTERLEVSVPNRNSKVFVVRPLDVVTIQLTCDNWDVRARVPLPRFILLSRKNTSNISTATKSTENKVSVTSETLTKSSSSKTKSTSGSALTVHTDNLSLYDLVSAISIRPVLDVPLRRDLATNNINDNKRASSTTIPSTFIEKFQGRRVFGGFINPDTRSYAQEESLRQAATETAVRRMNAMEAASRRNEFSQSQTTERNITSRQQRLAADKRNTRKSKTK
jgi:RNB domain